ncbi:hypothetical protein EHI8A_011480 [Entamoeba histolytica HM-1:IMSS-B]|uniref:U6 snRNA phosphodiesterase n=6 Tax=Entamoeba histolytica TaxID=5759 RepID=C4LTL3_ENTH1|nr:hypothetical protein EHI_012200 [Entamoeba histolytica HM-1:IMSS]EMD43245.1 Hypothetical protein EHI5A_020570 [Entamoeba histolytica KU27]EMH76345.1 hypothetical protein EHI8A_011480 [Entamoeba histolytica HM-1:IMSS-B]EMS13180.1 hypothetical protein KM1_030310 [Entamoeba histolytica HM-3:IMSS]ENY61843.1 hypothetical protein EHI7A_070160 [Entamoeba histolytica HM-1:IMSS-A]GAT91906.1 hypothetical protein CL6EHI_012200 [Entamoeba histolytica]|eukprot:XP_656188.1 hypothetical protein EHI_012200 [Entamoeba histolytica HM-1:IMSS]
MTDHEETSTQKAVSLTDTNDLFQLLNELESRFLPMRSREKKEVDIGRIQQRPHKIGEYPGSVYIEIPIEIKNKIMEETNQFSQDFKPIQSLHISLTKEFSLREHQIPLFVQEVRKKIKRLPTFTITFGQLELLLNPEQNTEFLSIQVTSPEILSLIDLLDTVMMSFNLEKYYEERKIHSSLMYRTEHLKEPYELSSFNKCLLSFKPATIKIRLGEIVYTCVLGGYSM